MNSFERITIEGYRRLFNVQVDMRNRPLTVMIGANGVGKTSLLEIFSLLAASANAQLANKISELGGLPDIITRDRANSIAISLSMSVPGYAPLDYQLEVALKGFIYEIALETLTQQNNRHAVEPFKHIDSRGLDVHKIKSYCVQIGIIIPLKLLLLKCQKCIKSLRIYVND
jgi:predicted ATPase